VLVVFYNKLSWFVSELPEKDISVKHGGPVLVVFYNKLPWFVFELYLKTICPKRVVVQFIGSILQCQ
jgi:hypothetical protein